MEEEREKKTSVSLFVEGAKVDTFALTLQVECTHMHTHTRMCAATRAGVRIVFALLFKRTTGPSFSLSRVFTNSLIPLYSCFPVAELVYFHLCLVFRLLSYLLFSILLRSFCSGLVVCKANFEVAFYRIARLYFKFCIFCKNCALIPVRYA